MRRSLWLAALCTLAFALSCAYVRFYLRGGPRIIDATSYWLEARALSAGGFSFHVPDPSAAFRGRFLLASSDGHELGVLFPPGYPLLLALGMRLGAPLLVGPTLGALLVLATYALTRALGESTKVALLAATLSALSAALRYHTADTMSHGLAALLGTSALALVHLQRPRLGPLLTGACLGLLVATRPVSAGVACLLVGFTLRARPRAWPLLLAGMLPGVALLLAQQRALTGSLFGSTQLAYYGASDAPPGCFRYGFGSGVGCRFEHGRYVERFLPQGFGASHALRNLGVHLLAFTTDATNAAPLSLVALYGLARRWRSLGVLGAGVALQALAYVPFYFDGDYPGGGARFLCEAIPLCQILVARALCDLGMAWLGPVAALAGFGLYARHGHEQLRDREGGRPMFEPSVVQAAGVTRGLVLVDSDHGFNLGHDPRAAGAGRELLVARFRDDAHDRQLYERLGRPPTFRYVFDFQGRSAPRLTPFVPPEAMRFEAEAEWPALLLRGSAYPIHRTCASGRKALRLLPGTAGTFWLPESAGAVLRVGWVSTGPSVTQLRVGWRGGSERLIPVSAAECSSFRLELPRPSGTAPLQVELLSGEGALDFIEPSGDPPG